jgi:hypothetical protein
LIRQTAWLGGNVPIFMPEAVALAPKRQVPEKAAVSFQRRKELV